MTKATIARQKFPLRPTVIKEASETSYPKVEDHRVSQISIPFREWQNKKILNLQSHSFCCHPLPYPTPSYYVHLVQFFVTRWRRIPPGSLAKAVHQHHGTTASAPRTMSTRWIAKEERQEGGWRKEELTPDIVVSLNRPVQRRPILNLKEHKFGTIPFVSQSRLSPALLPLTSMTETIWKTRQETSERRSCPAPHWLLSAKPLSPP